MSILVMIWMLVANVIFSHGVEATPCASKLNSTLTGYCITYPADGFCGRTYAGKSVWLANDTNLRMAEAMAEGMLNTIKKNKEQVSQECYDFTERQVCSRYFPPCYSLGEVEIPQLTCQGACEDYWSACQVAFDLYYDLTVLVPFPFQN